MTALIRITILPDGTVSHDGGPDLEVRLSDKQGWKPLISRYLPPATDVLHEPAEPLTCQQDATSLLVTNHSDKVIDAVFLFEDLRQ